ncbi:MAG: spore protease YyaC [Clostridia bacterium]
MGIPVVVCIGTASVAGDSLGPMVGDILREKYNVRAYVYGGMKQPVNGINYHTYIEHIKSRHNKSLIIAVDACVGEPNDVGKIKFTAGGVAAGGALNKNFEKVGNVGILGVVAEREKDNLKALMGVSYHLVENMSRTIAYKVYKLLLKWEIIRPYTKRIQIKQSQFPLRKQREYDII